MTLHAAYSHPIEKKIKAEYKAVQEVRLHQKINKTNSLLMMMDMAIRMFIKKKFSEALNTLDDLVYKTREVEKPGRKVLRPKKQKTTLYELKSHFNPYLNDVVL